MNAIAAPDPPSGPGWAWELKWDGIRALAYVVGDELAVFTRNGNQVTHRYPELAPLGGALAGRDAVLDGEIVAFTDTGTPSFELLQRRMHVESPPAIRRLATEVPVAYVLFDLLWLDRSLLSEPYRARRALLAGLDLTGPNWQTPPNEEGDGAAIIGVSRQFGLEGVVGKRVDSIYEPGRRSRAWVKVKNVRRQEFVVGGWLPGEGALAGTIGSLVIGYHTTDETKRPVLQYAGRVGSGLTERDRAELARVFARCARESSPFGAGTPPRETRFVEPILVVEVKFTEWTALGVVRQPTFVAFRTDKEPADVVREDI